MDFMNGETPPVPVPPASQGWDAMRKLLDEHMPPPKPPRKWPRNWFWAALAVAIAGGSLGVWKMRSHNALPRQEQTTTVHQAAVTDSVTMPHAMDNDDSLSGGKGPGTAHQVDSTTSQPNGTAATSKGGDVVNNVNVPTNITPAIPGANTNNRITPAAAHTGGKGEANAINHATANTVANAKPGPTNSIHPGKTGRTTSRDNALAPTKKPLTSRANTASRPRASAAPGDPQHNAANTAYTTTGNNTQLTTATPDQHNGTAANTPQQATNASRQGYGGNSLSPGATAAEAPLHVLFTEDRLYHPASLRGRDSLKGRSNLALPSPPPQPQKDAFTAWRIWLQWNPALPLQGTDNYFKGPDGSNQAWRPFVLALRVTRTLGKGALALDAIPVTSQQTDAVFFRDTGFSQDSVSQQDSVYHTRSVVKQFGSAAILQYQYPLSPHWGVSAGVGASYWNKSLTRYRTELVQPASVTDSLKPSTAADLKPFSKVRIDGVAEIYYQAGRIQTGLRIGVPITGMGSDSARSYHNPVQAALIVRWTFLSLKKRR